MIRVVGTDDQEFNERVVEQDGKHYLAVWKDHFSPYAMIDKLTDNDKGIGTPNNTPDNTPNNNPDNTPTSNGTNVKTGDNSQLYCFAATLALIISGLYLEICMKRKKIKTKKYSTQNRSLYVNYHPSFCLLKTGIYI